MRTSSLFLAAAVATAGIAAACSPPAIEPPPAAPTPPAPAASPVDSPDYDGMERTIIHLVNNARAEAGLDTLVWNESLDRAAKMQAVQMASRGVMAHEFPDAPQPTFSARINFSGYRYLHAGENIALGEADAAAVVRSWMSSPHHRGNIMQSYFKETGVGVARSKTGVFYFSQIYGTQRDF